MTVSRDYYDEARNWTEPQWQEGVPVMDADLNLAHRMSKQWLRRAVSGLFGNGTSNSGFLLTGSAADPLIGAGDIFIIGWRVFLESSIPASEQPNPQTFPAGDGVWYLDVLETLVTSAEAPELRDPRLPSAVETPLKVHKLDWTLKKVLGPDMPAADGARAHLAVAIEESGALIDMRNAGMISAGPDTGFLAWPGGKLGHGHGHDDEQIRVDSPEWSGDNLELVLGEIDSRLGVVEGGGAPPAAHAAAHHDGGSDPLALGSIAGGLSGGQHGNLSGAGAVIMHDGSQIAGGVTPGAHAESHQHGGADAVSLDLDHLADTQAPSPSHGEVLTWDQGAARWVAAEAGAGAVKFSELDDDAMGVWDSGMNRGVDDSNNTGMRLTLKRKTGSGGNVFGHYLSMASDVSSGMLHGLYVTAGGGSGSAEKTIGGWFRATGPVEHYGADLVCHNALDAEPGAWKSNLLLAGIDSDPGGANRRTHVYAVCGTGHRAMHVTTSSNVTWPSPVDAATAATHLVVNNHSIAAMISALAPGGTDERVKVSAADTTPGRLEDKLVAGAGVTLTKQSPGGNETLLIESSGAAGGFHDLTTTGRDFKTYTHPGATLAVDRWGMYLDMAATYAAGDSTGAHFGIQSDILARDLTGMKVSAAHTNGAAALIGLDAAASLTNLQASAQVRGMKAQSVTTGSSSYAAYGVGIEGSAAGNGPNDRAVGVRGHASSVYPKQCFGGEFDHNDAKNGLTDADHRADVRLANGSLCVPSHYLFVKGFNSMYRIDLAALASWSASGDPADRALICKLGGGPDY